MSFGAGVPLRPLYETAVEQGQPRVCGVSPAQKRPGEGGPDFRQIPTVAPWVQLPARDPGRAKADAAQARRRRHPCGFLYRTSGGKS